jgi:hypothetical protein
MPYHISLKSLVCLPCSSFNPQMPQVPLCDVRITFKVLEQKMKVVFHPTIIETAC